MKENKKGRQQQIYIITISTFNMKKLACFACLVLLVLSMQGALAITTDIRESYSQGETVVTKIEGNILAPIKSTNIELKRAGHILVPMEYELNKLGEDYYLWFITPASENNYTLFINNISTTVSGNTREVSYQKNFSVSGNLTDYFIKPGAVLTTEDFEIKVVLNEDLDKSIDVKFIEESEFTLKPGENTIKFSIEGINETTIVNASIGKYDLPVYVRVNKTTIAVNLTENETITNVTNENASILIENLSEETNLTQSQEQVVNEERAKYHCYEYPGKICEANQVCSGQTIVSADGSCCVNGDCAVSSGGGGYAWVGYLIGALVLVGIVFLIIKYRKVKVEGNPLQKKVESIEKKI